MRGLWAKRRWRGPGLLLAIVLLVLAGLRPVGAQPGAAVPGAPPATGIDWSDPYAATVVGTPPALRAELPILDRDRNRNLTPIFLPVIADRAIPQIFWYYRDGLRIELAAQRGPAPLAFLIAGTGGSASSPSALLLARVLLKAGMHVAILPSPSFPEFIVTASSTAVPGRPREDAQDLYRAMRLALPALQRRVEITGFNLVGFSLGAMNAAFVADLDARERRFGFDRVLLVNPPVDLKQSIPIVDRFLDVYVQRDPLAVQRFINEVFEALAQVYSERPGTELTGEDLYQTLGRLQNREAALEMLIGLVFRVSAGAMAFTTDLLVHAGYMIARDARPGITNSLTRTFQVSLDLSFTQFVEEVVLPFYIKRDPSLSVASLWSEARLEAIGPFLRTRPRIAAITNRDDIILGPNDLERLRRLFGERLTVLPNGGHGGSIGRPDFVDAVLRFFAP